MGPVSGPHRSLVAPIEGLPERGPLQHHFHPTAVLQRLEHPVRRPLLLLCHRGRRLPDCAVVRQTARPPDQHVTSGPTLNKLYTNFIQTL
eukprot:959140-Prorocentrum_minimum.AAC.3